MPAPALKPFPLRSHAAERSLSLVQASGRVAVTPQALSALDRRGQLMRRAGLAMGQEPEVVEWTKALAGLQPQEVGIVADGLGQERLGIPRIGDNDIVRTKLVHRLSEAGLDRQHPPAGVIKLQYLWLIGERRLDASHAPGQVAAEDVPHIEAGLGQKVIQLDRVDDPATRRGPIEKEAQDRHPRGAIGGGRVRVGRTRAT